MLKRPCNFFNSTGKCHFDKHCKFLHEPVIQEQAENHQNQDEAIKEPHQKSKQTVEQPLSSKAKDQGKNGSLNKKVAKAVGRVKPSVVKGVNICKLYADTKRCRYGKRCRFQHDAPNPNPSISLDDLNNNQHVEQEKVQDEGSKIDDAGREKNDSFLSDSTICKFYAENRFCRYGKRCRYRHVAKPLPNKVAKATDLKTKNQDDQSKITKGDKDTEKSQATIQNDKELQNISVEKGTNHRKICRFLKKGDCKFGKKCRNFHPKDSNNVVETADKVSFDKKKTPVRRPRARNPQIINQIYKREDLTEEKIKELRQTEITQLKKRFPTGQLQTVEETDECAKFIFSFTPTDPDWPFDVTTFEIEVTFKEDYPIELFVLKVPFEQDLLPTTLRRYIEVSLEEWRTQKQEDCQMKGTVELLFRPFLRWLDKNMETIVTEGLKQLKRELEAAAAGLQFIPVKELQENLYNKASTDTDDNQASSDSEEFEDHAPDEVDKEPLVVYRKSEHPEEEVYMPSKYEVNDSDTDSDCSNDGNDTTEETDQTQHKRPQIDSDTARRGTEMAYRSKHVWFLSTVLMEKLRLTVQCDRCKHQTDFSTPPNRVNSVLCGKCNTKQLVVFRATLAHANSNVCGYLDLEGCTVYDVILQDCHFSMGCLMCSRESLVKTFIPGKIMESVCRGCHNRIKFGAESMKLRKLVDTGVDTSQFSGSIHTVKVGNMVRAEKNSAIQEGKPLPDNGACKHYKKSFRWIRFPCCGKCYPCDVCHDDREDHEMKFANRMICGYCCREQPYSSERPCVGCSSSLTKAHSSHWEGGKGCRNKVVMSRDDDKKYSNLNKTTCNTVQVLKEKAKAKGKKVVKQRMA